MNSPIRALEDTVSGKNSEPEGLRLPTEPPCWEVCQLLVLHARQRRKEEISRLLVRFFTLLKRS